MRVLGVAQAFKETLPARVVARSMEVGIKRAGARGDVILASDGGDGLGEALERFYHRTTRHDVTGPLGRPVTVPVGWLDPRVAVVESRLVCGLALVPRDERDPTRTTTKGLGELVGQLERDGAHELFIGLGGSATMDGGLGMARAWGWVPRDASGLELPEGGGALGDLVELVQGSALAVRITGLVDVLNPLTGVGGARVYAPQKGATPAQCERLERGLEKLAAVARERGKGDLVQQPGAGAAGGLGFGLAFFAGGTLRPGAPWVLERVGFDDALANTDLVICGEGAFDQTSLSGKLTGSVLEAARRAGRRAGLLAPRAEHVPAGVVVEMGGGTWTAEDIVRRTQSLVTRTLRPGPRR